MSGANTGFAADSFAAEISEEIDKNTDNPGQSSSGTAADPEEEIDKEKNKETKEDDPSDEPGKGGGADPADINDPIVPNEDDDEENADESDEEASLETSEEEELVSACASSASSEDDKKRVTEDIPVATGYIPEDNPIPVIHNDSDEILVRGGSNLPSKWINENLPPLRYQGIHGTCWAFAATAIEEINLMKKGTNDPDLSELHLAYFSKHSIVDPLGGTAGDYCLEPNDKILRDGGNVDEALNTHMQWMGPADESTAPYDPDENPLGSEGLSDDIAYDAVAHIQNYYVEEVDLSAFRSSQDASYFDNVKNMIREYGSVAMSYGVPNDFSPDSDSNYYNMENNCYYNPGTGGTGHAIVIVGWDDNFSQNNFATKAPGDGAFLVRNSWAPEWYAEDYGEYTGRGYFWMSYYEATLSPRFYSVECDPTDNYDNNYQYDGNTEGYSIGYDKVSNVFTAHAEGASAGEVLKAVSFYTASAGADYTVEIYTGVKDKPDSGNLEADSTVSGTLQYAGVHTIELKEPVYLEAGEKFAVAVECENLIKEMAFSNSHTGSASRKGESFSFEHNNWFDAGTTGNFKVKAFTCTRDEGSYVAPKSIDFLNVTDDKLDVGITEVFKVNTKVLPANASEKTVKWKSSDDSVATVENGRITGVSEGEAVITASVLNGQIKRTINVTVRKKLLDMEISERVWSNGLVELVVNYTPEDYVPTENIKWSSSDENVAVVLPSGYVSEKMMGQTMITAELEGVRSQLLHTVSPSEKYVDYDTSDDKIVTFNWKAVKNAKRFLIYRDSFMNDPIAQITADGRESYEYSDNYYKGRDTGSATYLFEVEYEKFNGVSVGTFYIVFGKTYKITYHLNGGTQNPNNPEKYVCGRQYDLYGPTPPDGYEFEGWYTSTDYDYDHYRYCIYDSDEGNMDLYAKYAPMDPKLSVTPKTLYLAPGESGTITAETTPSNENEKCTFTCYDDEMLGINVNGNTATVTAGQTEGGCTVRVDFYTCAEFVTVRIRKPIYFMVEDYYFTADPGKTYELQAQLASDLADKLIDWSSSDESVCTVSDGVLYPAEELEESSNVTITAKIRGTNYSASCKVHLTPPFRVKQIKGCIAGEIIEPGDITVPQGTRIELVADPKGAMIVYTTDGSDPVVSENFEIGENTKVYQGQIILSKDTVIKAKGRIGGYIDSKISTFRITVQRAPKIKTGATLGYLNDVLIETDEEIKVTKGSVLRLSSQTDGAAVYYALDGKEPMVDEDGNILNDDTLRYEQPFRIEDDIIVKALSLKEGGLPGDMTTIRLVVNNDDWGDIDNEAVREKLFQNKSSLVENVVWYYFEDDEGTLIEECYKGSSKLDLVKEYTSARITAGENIHVFHGTRVLIEGRDYTLSYKNNTKVATADSKAAPQVTVKGKGNYASTAVFKFNIGEAPLSKTEIASEKEVAVMTGAKVKLSVTKPKVTFAGKALKAGTDYILTYYEGENKERLIDDPAAEILNEAGKTYIIDISASAAGSFYDDGKELLVKLETKDPATTVSASKLKVVDAKGKALKVAYDHEKAFDLEELFDNKSEGANPTAFVKYGKTVLTFGEDYEVEPVSEGYIYKAAGKHKYVIRGKGGFAGNKTETLEIVGIPMSKVKIAGLLTSAEYTGNVIDLDRDLFNAKDKNLEADWDKVTLYYVDPVTKNKAELVRSNDANTGDYTVSEIKNVNPGKFTLVFTGINGFSGSIKKTVTIKAYNVKKDLGKKLDIQVDDAVFTKAGARPKVTVKFITEKNEDGSVKSALTLKEGIDYSLTFKNNLKAADKSAKGAPAVIVKGIGNYTASTTAKTFTITKAPIDTAVLVASDVAYKPTGKRGYFLSVPKVYEGGKALTVGRGKDLETFNKAEVKYTYANKTILEDENHTEVLAGWEVSPDDKIPCGTSIVVSIPVSGLGCGEKSSFEHRDGEETEISGSFRILGKDTNISGYKVRLKNPNGFTFNNGNAIILEEDDIEVYKTVKKNTVYLKPTDFEIESVTNNRFLGKAVIVIKGKEEYWGTKTLSVKLGAKKMSGN